MTNATIIPTTPKEATKWPHGEHPPHKESHPNDTVVIFWQRINERQQNSVALFMCCSKCFIVGAVVEDSEYMDSSHAKKIMLKHCSWQIDKFSLISLFI